MAAMAGMPAAFQVGVHKRMSRRKNCSDLEQQPHVTGPAYWNLLRTKEYCSPVLD